MKRALLIWALPPCVLFAVYWLGLWVWFHGDDFTLLWLAQLPAGEFWPQLVEPRAQGTFRPLSERIFFHLFYDWFGLNAFPYRLLVFATQVVNLWLFVSIAQRISRSQTAATLGACLWAAHHGLAVTMSWSSAYNQALYSFFLLLSFWLFMKFADTGRVGLYALQWVTFIVGFGALESIVVYPVLIIAWCVFFRPDRLRWAAPMLIGSIALTWILLNGLSADRPDAYSMVLTPGALTETLLYYLQNAFAARQPAWFAVVVGVPLAAAAIYEATKGRWVALFGCSWFFITLTPFLPLAGHLSDYYLFLPAAGLAIAAAAIAAPYWRLGWAARAPIVVALGLWTAATIDYAYAEVSANYRESVQARNLVSELAFAQAAHPNKTLLLVGIQETLFHSSIYLELFSVTGLFNIYLAPDSLIDRQRAGLSVDRFFLSRKDTLRGIERDWLVVYDASGISLRGITAQYRRSSLEQPSPPTDSP